MHWAVYVAVPIVPIALYTILKPSPPPRSWENIEYPKCTFTKLNERTWVVSALGDRLPKNMTIYKFNDTDLWLHSVIAMNPDDMSKLESLGTPKVLVVPNSQHRLDAALYKERYPGILVTTPSFCQKSTEAVVKMDMTVEDWTKEQKDIIAHHANGTGQFELVYELRYDSGTKAVLVFCDQLFNITTHMDGFKGTILKYMGSTGFFGVTGIGNLMLKAMGNKEEFNAPKLIKGLSQITVGHGDPILEDKIESKLKEAIAYLE
jgi:hypothetical protein